MAKHELIRRVCSGMAHFLQRQGYGLLITGCVAVITASAVWAAQDKPAHVPAPTEAERDVSAAQLLQESLSKAVTPSPAPTAAPVWHAPLLQVDVLRAFSVDAMVRSGVTGLWRIHPGVDLQCAAGDGVFAMMDGTVDAVGQDDMRGHWVRIDHGGGVIATYAGMAAADCKTGEKVRQGHQIGTGGSGLADEADLGPHLHLEVRRNGVFIDPLTLLP